MCLALVQSMYDSQPVTTVVPNRLSSVRELLHEKLRAWLPRFCVAVSKCDGRGSGMPATIISGQLTKAVIQLVWVFWYTFGINIHFASKRPSSFCWACDRSIRRVPVMCMLFPSPLARHPRCLRVGLSFPTQQSDLLFCSASRAGFSCCFL